jgi:hypothetical protein
MTTLRRYVVGLLVPVVALVSAEPAAARSRATGAQPCRVGDVTQQVKTDRTSYPLGRPVKLTVTARNDSHRVCTPPGLVQVAVDDATGAEVFHAGISLRWKPGKTWRPGRTFKWSAEWDQGAPGSYRAHGGWDEFREGSAAFTITTR